ncbi:MAG: hypothetical protein EXQ92_00825 [Alphaproteobacteria bacterium]|nr:hypothetical protein [Alphaproteobacteria bacterium]
MPPGSAPLKQFGSGVYELRDSHAGDAYRGIYLVKLAHGVYVLHMFKKKSKVGRSMPNEIVATIASRIKQAQMMDRELETP